MKAFRFSVAPMMECTDRHCRYFFRLLTKRALLYTEMVHAAAVVHGDTQRLLAFDPVEKPVALQLGGSDPTEMAQAARVGVDFGYDEINLNVGCPSDRVQSGRFGACLMAEPERVAECVSAIRATVHIPVTVKTRVGIDQTEGLDFLLNFVDSVARAGCRRFIIHARKAWLRGLSPKQNREVPPLRYDIVHQLKAARPELRIVINGGIDGIAHAQTQLRFVDGVMIGRAAYHNPYLLAAVDRSLFGQSHPVPTREDVICALEPYIADQLAQGVPVHAITRHVLGLFRGQPGAKRWRRYLSDRRYREHAGAHTVTAAFDALRKAA